MLTQMGTETSPTLTSYLHTWLRRDFGAEAHVHELLSLFYLRPASWSGSLRGVFLT